MYRFVGQEGAFIYNYRVLKILEKQRKSERKTEGGQMEERSKRESLSFAVVFSKCPQTAVAGPG